MGPTRRARHKAPVEAGSKPSKHAGSDSEALWLRPVMAITTASVQQESDRVVCIYLPKPTPRIRFGSVLPKKARIALCKTGADPTWMACSGFGLTYLVRKQVGEQESSAPVLVERNRLATSFPTFRLGCTLPQTPRILLCKTNPDPILFWLTVRLWPNGSGPKAGRCARIIGPASGQASELVRIGCESDPAC